MHMMFHSVPTLNIGWLQKCFAAGQTHRLLTLIVHSLRRFPIPTDIDEDLSPFWCHWTDLRNCPPSMAMKFIETIPEMKALFLAINNLEICIALLKLTFASFDV